MSDSITITIRDNGPFVIAGDDMAKVRLVDHTGAEISTEGRKALSLGSAAAPRPVVRRVARVLAPYFAKGSAPAGLVT